MDDQNKKYRFRISCIIVDIFASILLTIGVILLFAGSLGIAAGAKIDTTVNIVGGVSCIISSVFLFMISGVSEDVHKIAFLAECQEEQSYYTLKCLEHLESSIAQSKQADEKDKKPEQNCQVQTSPDITKPSTPFSPNNPDFFRNGGWICPQCAKLNTGERTYCWSCGRGKGD